MILGPPAGDAFNFSTSHMIHFFSLPQPLLTRAPAVTDLQVYPSAFFSLMLSFGLYVVRWRRRKANLPRSAYRAWDPLVIFSILVQLFLMVMPWYPPDGGPFAGDVSFWYATYVVTGVGM